jgi:uncharacterized protein (TIGR02453 family)
MKKAHFSRDLFGFLEELRSNNRREWFEANRARYERDVREPMLTFITDFAPRLRKISPKLVADPRPSGGSMFRIYRDVLPYLSLRSCTTLEFRKRRRIETQLPA